MSNIIKPKPRGPVRRVAIVENDKVVNVAVFLMSHRLKPNEVKVDRAEIGDTLIGGVVTPGVGNSPRSAEKMTLQRALRSMNKWIGFQAAYAAVSEDKREDWDASTVLLKDGDLVQFFAPLIPLSAGELSRAFILAGREARKGAA